MVYVFKKGKNYHRSSFKEVEKQAIPNMELIKYLHHTYTALKSFRVQVKYVNS
jgi:hypothetical protein